MDSDRSLSGTPGTPGSNMSTSSSLAPGNRIMSVKSSIDGIGWDPERRERLEEYVVTVHNITTHAYSLSKYIFLRAIQEDENFDIRQCINCDFFAEVWLKLTRIYYDSKARPVEHMRAFYELALSFIDIELPVFNCFPLRRSWIPCYTTIDSKILCQNILGRRWTNRQDKIALWRELINLNSDALKHQENGELQFKGTIQTDGVGVTYISQEIAQETVGRCVTIDPGRRDLLFCVHENSTANNPNKFRFTKQYQDKFEKINKYRRIREAVKPARVAAAERLLVNYDSLNRDEFEQYLENRSNMTGIIQIHYVNFRTNHRTAHSLHRKLRLSAYIRRQQENEDLISKIYEQFGVEAVYVMAMTNNTNRIVPRLWNCVMAACLSMVDIVRSLRAGNGIPPIFRRGEVPQNQRRRARTQNEQANIRNVRQCRN
ncbi:uncharacterized protein EV154DRAFT_435263 [Mucor mucedo]|uniref:uncharacterized protein n=1 Tax=Mucor mucedo TaxID=29922 RepID=UPI00221F7B67|nr:uncharacterized protein EV154DRAFT_435263 [Mucor mucedo]KAI7896240.1 hypothetical protein EV154DRAFT_435263 [Mucor mucedo]